MSETDLKTGRALPWIIGVVVFLCLSVIGVRFGPSPITGDETEYYAMTYAWATTGSPTLTPEVISATRTAIPGRSPTEPAVARAVDGSYNAIHFWFLSFLDVPFFALCRWTGLNWRHCFVFLNALAFGSVAALAYRWFRWFGAAVLIVGLLDSPFMPYLNKAHGEAYSVALTAIAALCLLTDRWLAAALALAGVAAQVSAFSPLVVIALAKWAYSEWRARQRPTPKEWVCVAACTALLGLQPLWTLWRYHTLNLIVSQHFVFPEMATPKRMASMLVDPDVGFFLLWPLSLALIVLIAASFTRRYAAYWAFVAITVAMISYIGAQQANYTTSAPRYWLWFIPLLLAGFAAHVGPRSRLARANLFAFFLLAATATGYYLYFVTGITPKLERKPLAELWYRYFPGAWDPDEQVFVDLTMRQQLVSGHDFFFKRRFPVSRLPNPQLWAMSNKGCTKLLVFAYAFTSSRVEPLAPLGCEAPVDPRQLLEYVRHTGGRGMQDSYVSIRNPPDTQQPRNVPPPEAIARPPKVVSYEVAAAEGTNVRTFRFSDSAGWQDLDTAMIIFANNRVPDQTCYVTYNQPSDELSVMSDNGTIAPAKVPGWPGELKARWCSVDPRTTSVYGKGDSLTVKLAIALDPALAANGTIVRAGVTNLDQLSSGWIRMDGGIRPEPRPASSPDIGFDPVPGSPDLVDVRLKGAARVWILMNDKLSAENSCYFEYEPAGGVVRLIPDNGDGKKALALRLRDGRSIENGQCIVDARGSTLEADRLRIKVVRKGVFASTKHVWAKTQGMDGTLSTWLELGLWRGAGSELASLTVSLKPDAQGDLLHVWFDYGATEVKDVARVWLLVNNAVEGAGSCWLTFEPDTGTVYLNEAGKNGEAGRMLLSERRSLTNPQCEVNGRESTAEVGRTTLDLRLHVVRKGGFRGPKGVFAGDVKNSGKVTTWMPVGTWRL